MRSILALLVVFGVTLELCEANFVDSLFNLFSASSDDSDLDRLLGMELEHRREKRQENTVQPPAVPPTVPPGVSSMLCPTELFRRMDKCCKLPTMYTQDTLSKCNGKNMLMALPKGPRKNIRPVQLRLRKNYLVSSPKNATIRSRIEDIITPENYIDENLMWSTMQILMPPGPYALLLQSHVRVECGGLAFFGDFNSNVTNMYGQKCFIAPFRMLRCIKRSMLLAYNTCPGVIAQNQQCDMDKNVLKFCDIYGV